MTEYRECGAHSGTDCEGADTSADEIKGEAEQ
jgi:hypothetical protein